MTSRQPTALIADDEPLLRDALERLLYQAWPELKVTARARNGREAIESFERQLPDICFLDVQMPGKSGIEAARQIGTRAHLVFVTAFNQYALDAFDRGAIDYLVKPVEPERLQETVARLKQRLRHDQPAVDTAALLESIASSLRQQPASQWLRWLRASIGDTTRLIQTQDVDFLRSEDKYTVVAWRDDARLPQQAIIRTSLKDLTEQLDPALFARVHRSIVVNLKAISHITRGENETAEIHLKGSPEVLPVSRTYLHLFRNM